MSNIITINDNSTNLSVTIPAPVSNSQITVLEPTTAFITYDSIAAAGAGGGYVNIVTGDSRIIINKNNNEVNISFDDTGLLTSETLTTLSLVGNSLNYSDEEGDTTSIDLSSYLDDTNDFLNQASFNSSNGVLTLSVENQSDVTVNLDGRYLTSSSIGANVTDQYIPKYSDLDQSFVDSPSYVTSESVVVSTDNTDDTPAVNLYYNPQVEPAVTELTVTATEIPNVDDNSDNDLNKGFYYADDKYIYGGTATEPNINLVDTNTGVVTTLYDGTYLSDPEYDRFVYIAPDRFIALSFKIVDFGGSGLKPGISLFSFDGSTLNKLSTLEITDYIGGYIEVFYDSVNDVIWALNGAGGFVKLIIDNDELSYVSSHTAGDSRINLHQLDPVKILGENDGFIYIAVDDASEPQALFYKMQLTGSFVEPDFIVNTDVIKLGGNPYPSDLWEVTDPSLDKFSESIWFMTNAGGSSNFGEANLYRVDISTGTIHKPFSSSFDSSGVAQYDNHFGVLYVANTIYDSGSNTFTYTTAYDVDSDGSLTKIKEIGGDLAGEKRIFGTPYWGQTVINNATGSIFNVDDHKHLSVSSPFYNQNTSSSNLYLDESTVKTKAELTYGAYSILESDSPVDPISFFGLNTDGAIYAAKSPDAVSHHWYTNEFDTGVYIKVMSLDEDGLIIYKASDETSAVVTKDSIDNWNYAYNNTIEALSFNSSTGVITATQLDGGTLTVDISALYDDTDTTYTVSTSDNVSSGVDLNLVGSDSTTDSINIVGGADVTVTQANDVITISAPHETTTSLSFNSGTLLYRDENNVFTFIDLTSLSYDTTYYLDAFEQTGATPGVDVLLIGSDGSSVILPFKGANDVSVSLVNGDIVVDAPHETTTSLSFNSVSSELTYNDEDGTANIVSLSSLVETVTSISFTSGTNTITYVDEDNTSTDLVLDAYDYNIELGLLSANTIPVQLNDAAGGSSSVSIIGSTNVTIGNPSQNVISIASKDTTYDLNAGGTTNGTVTVTLTDGTNNDVVTIVGTNDVAVTQDSGTITIDTPHETTTSISLVNNEILYTDEDGGITNLSLLPYLDDTDTTYSVSTTNAVSGANIVLTAGGSGSGTDSVSIVGGNNVTVTQASDVITVAAADETVTSIALNANILKYTDEAGNETDINLSLYLDDTNLARLTSGTLNGSTGIATFTRDDASTFTVDFSALLDDTDSTYDLSAKDNATSGVDIDLTAGGASSGTDTVVVRGANGVAVTQASGVITIDGAVASTDNYADALSFNTTSRVLTVGRTGSLSDLTATIPDNYVDALSFNDSTRVLTIGRTGSLSDLTANVPDNYVDNISWASGTGVLTIERTGSLADITVSLDGRYLQSYTEVDTLQSVTDRGNTTTNNMQVYSGTTNHTWIKPSEIQFKGGGSILPTNNTESLNVGNNNTSFNNIDLNFLSNFRVSRAGVVVLQLDTGLTQERMAFNSVLGGLYSGSTTGGQANFAVGGTGEFTGDLVVNNDAYINNNLDVDGITTSDSFQNSSSIRYKENVKDLEDLTEAVMAMRPVRYNVKKTGKNDIGFIAEEVNELFPEIVGKNKDDQVESMDYARLSVVLLQQVQKQQSLIEKLEERISKLESK